MTTRVDKTIYTLDVCRMAAAPYDSMMAFRTEKRAVYKAITRNNWIDECCAHMKRIPIQRTKDDCLAISIAFLTRKEFRARHPNVVAFAYKHGFLDEICFHMSVSGNTKRRFVYEICGTERYFIYIGISFNPIKRYEQHKNRGSSKVMNAIKEPHTFSTTGPMPVESALILEKERIAFYREIGFDVLNVSNGGSPGGGTRKWTRAMCHAEANKYNTRSAFMRKSAGAYDAAMTNGWLEYCCAHMTPLHCSWTKEQCIAEARRYQSPLEFRRGSPKAFGAAYNRGWAAECMAHMSMRRKWTFESCLNEAKKHSHRTSFGKVIGAYSAARKNGWLEQCCAHMKRPPPHNKKERL